MLARETCRHRRHTSVFGAREGFVRLGVADEDDDRALIALFGIVEVEQIGMALLEEIRQAAASAKKMVDDDLVSWTEFGTAPQDPASSSAAARL